MLTGIPGFTGKPCCLLMTFPSPPMNEHADLQTVLNKLRVYAENKSLTVNTQKSEVMCFISNSENLPPLYFDGVMLPYTDSFKYLGMVCNKQINLNTAADAALCPFTAGTFRVKEFVQKHNLNHAGSVITTSGVFSFLTGYTRTYGFSRQTLLRLVCMQVRFGPLLTYNNVGMLESLTG